MNVSRRGFLAAGAAAVMALSATGAQAGGYPDHPVKIIVGYVPGGGPDTVARVLSSSLSQIFGQAFVVENRPGASGTLATSTVARAPADGYTLLLGETGQLVIAPHMFKRLSYDTAKDLQPIGLVGTGPLIVVSSGRTKIKTLSDLVREAKAHPGKLNYGTSGSGSIHNIAMEVFSADAKLEMMHIPYRGSGQSVSALLAGDVPVLVTSLAAAAPYIKDGSVNLLAVTSAKRIPGYPDTPSVSEIVKDYDFSSEMGVLGPARMPQDVVDKLSKAIKQATESPEFQAAFKSTNTLVTFTTPAEYAENIRRNLAKYDEAVKLAKIVVSE
jgi:tripartite-type tricarboxylate transporter receptor subunit TctC